MASCDEKVDLPATIPETAAKDGDIGNRASFSFSARRRKWATVGMVLIILATSAVVFFRFSGWHVIHDERFHIEQIQYFYRGDIKLVEGLTMVPGYHAVIAGIAKLTPLYPTRIGFRFVNLVLGLITLGVAYLIARKTAPNMAWARIGQIFFLPLMFPFFFLLYTDIFSMGVVLLAVWLTLKQRYNLAAIAAILSIATRQNNIIWLCFCVALAYVQHHGWQFSLATVHEHLRRCWLFGVGIAVFLAFVFINGGVAVGDKSAHPDFKLGPDNIYMALFFTAGIAMLVQPHSLVALARSFADKRGISIIAAMVGVGMLTYLTFQPDHPYNINDTIGLRGQIIRFVQSGPLERAAFSAVVSLGVALVLATPLVRGTAGVLALFSLLAMAPFWLIDVRYAFIPWTLWILFRRERSCNEEAVGLPIMMALSLGVMLAINSGINTPEVWFP